MESLYSTSIVTHKNRNHTNQRKKLKSMKFWRKNVNHHSESDDRNRNDDLDLLKAADSSGVEISGKIDGRKPL